MKSINYLHNRQENVTKNIHKRPEKKEREKALKLFFRFYHAPCHYLHRE